MPRLAPVVVLLGMLLSGCASATDPAPPAPPTPPAPPAAPTPPTPPAPPATDAATTRLVLGIGETAKLANGGRLTYLRLVNDSRCPPTVQCVWAGNAEVAMRWQPVRGKAREFALHTTPRGGDTRTQQVDDLQVTLVALDRGIAPRATLQVGPATP